ncbi:hypothetical protein [Serratia sp. BW106]|uniref:hypothetical protein n=1 Tax=Serratia sp. BW106 TaxID=1884636 RepID=UPI000BFF8110|nr:hypothetical protein [Serratia sp. BW106]
MSDKIPTHEFFCWRVSEAYCYYLLKHNQALVYRHMIGDIQVNQHFIAGLLDGRLNEKFSREGQAMFYFKLLKPFDRQPTENVIFVGGSALELNRRGIRYMNAFLREFGMMLMDIGVPEGNGHYRLPNEEEMKAYPWLA